MVRPGNVYRVVCTIFQSEKPIFIRASISRDGTELATSKQHVKEGETEVLQLLIPEITIPGNYIFRIEGNLNGALGGTVFSATRMVEYSPRFLTIFIQINRAVFTADQEVKFRIVVLTTDMKPYTQPIDINIVNPKGYVMKNYGSVYLNLGVGSFVYKLPLDPNRGWWKVQVVAKNQVEEKRIHVEKYYVPRVEVFMQMPEAVFDSDEYITGIANGWYLNSAPVYGNATLRVYVKTPAYHYKQSETLLLKEEQISQFEGLHEFNIKLSEVEELVTPLPGCSVKVEFHMYDRRMEFYNVGFSETRIIDGAVKIQFIESEPMFFKPGMPFRTYVAVSHGDLSRLSREKIKDSNLLILRTIVDRNGKAVSLPDIAGQVAEDGIFKLDFTMPDNIIKATIKAVYSDADEVAEAQITAFPYFSADKRRLHIFTSTKSPSVGEYLIMHVHGNFYMSYFKYVIISKGLVVHSGTEEVEKNMMKPIITFAITLSSEMAPSCFIIIYLVTADGILISDSLKVPVVLSKQNEFKFELNNRKDKTGVTLEFCLTAKPGNFLAVSGQDVDTSCVNCGQELSKASIVESLHKFDEPSQRPSKMMWSSRDVNPDQTDYFDSPNKGRDERETFDQAGLLLITDAIVSANSDICGNASRQFSCLDGTCIPIHKRCDGQNNCKNGFDEINCTRYVKREFDMDNFRVFRRSRYDQFYDAVDGDWSWFDLNSNGFDAFNEPVPNRASSWIFTAFEVSRERGLNIVELPLQYVGTKPFFVTAEMPPLCRRGEQVGIRVEIFNFLQTEIYVLAVLRASDDYKFVHVEALGDVESYNPKTSSGEHHHLIWIGPESSKPVYFPIVLLTVGEVTVTVEGWTHIGKDVVDVTIEVLPEGVTQFLHTSLLLDLKNQPISVKFLDINVTETPIVPYERWRRYLFQSPLGYVSLVGDVFGPTFSSGPINALTALRMPDRTGEMQLFNFAANLWSLKYLRLTNQLTPEVASPAFDELNYYYAYVMAYQHDGGYFTMFKDFQGSVWLTALIVRVFHETNFPDWENDIYIDPQIMIDGMNWILDWQTPLGSFMEPYRHNLDRKLNSRRHYDFSNPRNISLTAQVLLTLCEVNDLPGDLRTRISNAKLMATHYIVRQLSELTDPYEIALVTYALTKVNSAEKEMAFSMLDQMKFEQGGHVYWGVELRDPVKIIMENQRPYIQPRFPSKDDAINVETTAYALLVYVLTENTVQEQIVRWLNTMRSKDGGFISTRDTLVAMEALCEYSFRARVREITNLNVKVMPSAATGTQQRLHVTEENLWELQTMTLDNVWGHVDIQAQGSGFGIIQLDVQFGVDYQFLVIPPARHAFDLQVSMKYSGKNASRIHVTSCQRWTLMEESPVSGLAVLELQTPSGYYIHQDELNDYVRSREMPMLRRAKINHRYATFYFHFLDRQMTCVHFKFYRYFPVANMTLVMKARVYEYYSPEHYNETVIEVMSLYSLDICEVCGSYQCPYCPYFNTASIINLHLYIIKILFLGILIINCN